MRIADSVKTVGAVTVGSSPTPLGDGKSGAARCGFVAQASSTNTASVFLGDSSVTTSTGIELEPGKAITLAVQDESKVFAIVAAGTQSLRVMKLIA